ncbi:bifunctional [glutamine synthetase] adenylyltransferase/[glutamine synthetase]-adenylyl-L-tyrosine phosphorylase [Aquibaculum sediminis]|uniref:bifunctional [glutamine synthetase] adenylyltransferase/[glutamine synthetase]-adenylyl-L-tyrosine phosphorylase n=1 Tax=Aquibaculum sediminis TaxID=3231907 RepID=UPI0034526BAA
MDSDQLPSPDRLPLPVNSERADIGLTHWHERLERLDPAVRAAPAELAESDAGKALLRCIFGHSPFLGQCLLSDPAFLVDLGRLGPEACLEQTLADCRDPKLARKSRAEVEAGLRRAKRRVALVTAIADMTDAWPLLQVTQALSDFADAALDTALAHLLLSAHEREELVLADPERPLDRCGFSVLAMGKHGARELNYSSDIDLILLFDPDRIDYRRARGVQEGMVRMARELARLMDELTADGYVFRTDLRLRPDPGATPLCLSVNGALTYYESQGQNWERAAMIKARAAAGDQELGTSFLRELTPFIWRKHLDFWAIQDIHSIKRQIHAHKGGADVAVEGHNIKLGRGGIREIEFFVQTQQLIYGGRHPELRTPRTLDALHALTQAGRVTPEAAADMHAAYLFLRTLEHRLQMVDDKQTHSLPATAEGVAGIAAFMGCPDEAAFREVLLRHLRAVEAHYAELFEEAPSLAGPGNLVFTGGEPEPGTLTTLQEMGFKDGERVFNLVRAWHHGRYRATRSVRARQILTELMPALLQALGQGSDPDAALVRFDTFLSRLPAGVQLFSLLYQNPPLLEILAEILGHAPALAERLGRRPALLEAVIDTDFYAPLPDAQTLRAELDEAFRHCRDFQDQLDEARRWSTDHRFQVGVQILLGKIDPAIAARGLSALADVAIAALLAAVEEEMAASHGKVPGAGLAVIALGRLGAREMTLSSDLDLVFVYDCDDPAQESDGRKPLSASVYYGRLAQRLIAALSAPTGEGLLYEVDPRLRPSGASGPIALSLPGYQRYLEQDAWTWELMALTRFRVAAAVPDFAERIRKTLGVILTRTRDPDRLLLDVDNMRQRIAKQHPGRSPWDIKYMRGGLYDLDFIAQYLQLRHAAAHPEVLCGTSEAAFDSLARVRALDQETSAQLQQAINLLRRVQNYLRLTVGETFEPERTPTGLRAALARAAGVLDFETLERTLQTQTEAVANAYDRLIGEPAATLRAAAKQDE